jgi:nicotinamidase-related amidase
MHEEKMSKVTACLLILDSSNQDLQACGYSRSTVKENLRQLATSSVFKNKISARAAVPKFKAHLRVSQIIEELHGIEQIIDISKNNSSALDGTTTLERLRKSKATHVCVCGTSTDSSVSTTIKDLVANKFEVLVVSDATTSRNGKRGHEDGLQRLVSQYGSNILINTAEVDKKLGGNPILPFANSGSISEPSIAPSSALEASTFQKEQKEKKGVLARSSESEASKTSWSIERRDPGRQKRSLSSHPELNQIDRKEPCDEDPEQITPGTVNVAAQAADLAAKLQLRTPNPMQNVNPQWPAEKTAQEVMPLPMKASVSVDVAAKAKSLATMLKFRSHPGTPDPRQIIASSKPVALSKIIALSKISKDWQSLTSSSNGSTEAETMMQNPTMLKSSQLLDEDEKEGSEWQPPPQTSIIPILVSEVTIPTPTTTLHSKQEKHHAGRGRTDTEQEWATGYTTGPGRGDMRGRTSARRQFKTPKVMTDRRETWDRYGK